MHHIGAILVAQAAIAISLDLSREKDASIEFILCTVWGKSDPPFLQKTTIHNLPIPLHPHHQPSSNQTLPPLHTPPY